MRPLLSIRGRSAVAAAAFGLCSLHPARSLSFDIGDGWRDISIGGASSSFTGMTSVKTCEQLVQAILDNKQHARPPALVINVVTERLECDHLDGVSTQGQCVAVGWGLCCGRGGLNFPAERFILRWYVYSTNSSFLQTKIVLPLGRSLPVCSCVHAPTLCSVF